MELDINDVEDILVRYLDGREIVFRGKGLEKLRKLMKTSPALKTSKKPKQIVIEESGSEESFEEEKPKKKGKPVHAVNGGYSTISLDYREPTVAGSDGLHKPGTMSPHDLAREMQRQATVSSGIKYS